MKNSINNLSSRLDGIDQAYKDADAKLESDFNEKINGLSTRIDGLSTNIADVASKLNDLSKKVNDISKIFEEELNDLEKEIKDAKESIAEEARVRAAADIAEANARKSADDMLIRNLTILSIVFGIGMVASLTLGIIGVAKKKK